MVKIEDLEKLSYIIFRLTEVHAKLLELEESKKEALISGDLERLDEILILEQPFVMSSQSLEKQREKLTNDMGLIGISLKQIIEDYDEHDMYLIKSRSKELGSVLTKLKKVNLINMAILNSRITTLNKIFYSVETDKINDIYQKDGKVIKKENGNSRELI